MEPTKYIINMYTIFIDIINNLKNLGKVYTDADLCRKILRSLSRTWDSKVTIIQEAIDLRPRKLIGDLLEAT